MFARRPTSLQQYRPKQRALLLPEHSYSGYSLGYHAVILRLHTSTLRRFPTLPLLWEYSIYVPYRGEVSRAKTRDLIVYDELDDSELPGDIDDGQPRLHVHGRMDENPPEVSGAFRGQADSDWRLFTFTKTDDDYPSYELRIPTRQSASRVGYLNYRVPAGDRLDFEYLQQRLGEFFQSR